MMQQRGIKKGIEVLVQNPVKPYDEPKKARVIRTYPKPSNWLVVQYDNGSIQQIEEQFVTTMFEKNRKRIF